MKKLILAIACIIILFACGSSSEQKNEHQGDDAAEHANHESAKESESTEKKPLSPRTATMSNVGSNHIHIDYGSPGKRGRMIFGGLVGFGTVWATGAHKATTINFSKDVNINATDINAGKYGLFTIPGETEWTIIISKDWDMHLADDYDEANDIVRIQVQAQKLEEVVESLTFDIEEINEKSGTITIKWDQTAVSFDVENM